MKLAFTTLACPGWTIEQAAAAARQYGYEGIELRLLDGEILRADIDAATRQRVREACAGLPIVCVDTSIRIAQPDPAAREAQVREGMAFLELAAEWGSPVIRVFGGTPEGTSMDVAIAAAAECLAPLAERGAQLGVGVALETHDSFCHGADVAQVLARVPGPGAGVLWDLLHPYRVGEPLPDTIAYLSGRLLHTHIKDGRPPIGGGSNWDLTLLGEGEVPTRTILVALRDAGYTGWLAVEWEKKWHPEIADPEIALPQHIARLREYLG